MAARLCAAAMEGEAAGGHFPASEVDRGVKPVIAAKPF
jgi:hypothetical protein